MPPHMIFAIGISATAVIILGNFSSAINLYDQVFVCPSLPLKHYKLLLDYPIMIVDYLYIHIPMCTLFLQRYIPYEHISPRDYKKLVVLEFSLLQHELALAPVSYVNTGYELNFSILNLHFSHAQARSNHHLPTYREGLHCLYKPRALPQQLLILWLYPVILVSSDSKK